MNISIGHQLISMSFDRRRTNLLRVLAIESKIKDIEHGQDYLKYNREIRVLEAARKGTGSLSVRNPDDMNSVVELRRNSAVVGEYLGKYRLMMRGVQDQMDLLKAEKSRLKSELMAA
jgi:hypothetical protein